MLSRFSTSSSRAARPQSPFLLQNANVNLLAKMPKSIFSPKCQCQSPRQNANVNLLAKLPMSIPSPKCTTHEPLTPSPSRCPRAGLTQNCPTLGILRPLYLLSFDSHSSLPISAQNTSIELRSPDLCAKYEHRTVSCAFSNS